MKEQVSINFGDEDESTNALVYVCGLLEELVKEDFIVFETGSSDILTQGGASRYKDLRDSNFTLTPKDAVLATLAIVEEQKSRRAVSSLFELTTMFDEKNGEAN